MGKRTSFAFAAAENFELGIFDCPLNERLEIEAVLCGFNISEDRSCLGVLRREYRAAILVRLDGGFKSIDLARDLDDLGLVHTDNGAENGHAAGCIRADDSTDSLACYLTDAFTRNQSLYLLFFAYALCDLHHKAAHNDSEKLFGAVVAELFLNFCERYAVECDVAAPRRKLLAKAFNFEPCSVRGVWR